MIALFVDADNLNAPEWIDEACQQLESSGAKLAVRRAYGSAENLKSLSKVMLAWSIRPFVNLSLSKNTTDVALAVDAMDLACQSVRPKVIAIGSGDADFLPLVVRLRERGIRMVCVSERTKMAQEAIHAYDEVIYVGNEAHKVAEKSPVTPAPAKKVAAKKASAKKAVTPTPAALVPAKKAATKKTAAPAKGQGSAEVSIDQILTAAASLRLGQLQPLAKVVEQLHAAKLLGKNASSTKLFKKFPKNFELTPTKQPNEIRYVAT